MTCGVGSQSLYNAIAGAHVEFRPVVLIDGSPPLNKVELLRNRNIPFAHAIDPVPSDEFDSNSNRVVSRWPSGPNSMDFPWPIPIRNLFYRHVQGRSVSHDGTRRDEPIAHQPCPEICIALNGFRKVDKIERTPLR